MVVVAIAWRGVLSSYIDDGVACGEKSGITGAEEGAGVVGWEESEEVDC